MLQQPHVKVLLAAALLLAALPAWLAAQAAPTPEETEGPYYKPGSPERDTLYAEADSGKRITVSGRVLLADGKPAAHAWLDFWQADGKGRYDNQGFACRGHLFTGADGSYSLRTVLPGEYPGRTPHIHVKLRAGNSPVLTTQIYFPEFASRNRRDSIFDERLLVHWDPDGKTARFDFVLP
jgi:protocatechuate 3,4-dioxygenase beta subunit